MFQDLCRSISIQTTMSRWITAAIMVLIGASMSGSGVINKARHFRRVKRPQITFVFPSGQRYVCQSAWHESELGGCLLLLAELVST